MKEKIKKIILGYLPGFITGIIIFGTISVIAATYFPSNQTTYDNTNTELKSENVQDAIDELYGVCFPSAADQIIEDAGLEKDPYECRYFFTGANPNNYITFNDETAGWRIISVECDGTIKIMRTETIGWRVWDSSSNNWARPASLNTYLNEDYYNDKLNAIAKNQIVVKNWSIGGVTRDNNDLANQITSENGTKWNGKVALVTVSEYIRSNSNKSKCGSLSLNNDNYGSCKNTTWMFKNYYWWTLSPLANSTSGAFSVMPSGRIGNNYSVNYNSPEIRPVVYLSSEITLTGSGTQSDPYVVN